MAKTYRNNDPYNRQKLNKAKRNRRNANGKRRFEQRLENQFK